MNLIQYISYLKKRDEEIADVTKITSDSSLMRNSFKMKNIINDQFVCQFTRCINSIKISFIISQIR
ncbi:hypothetical protein pb186bvf_020671 [Paramecium bursaria]